MVVIFGPPPLPLFPASRLHQFSDSEAKKGWAPFLCFLCSPFVFYEQLPPKKKEEGSCVCMCELSVGPRGLKVRYENLFITAILGVAWILGGWFSGNNCIIGGDICGLGVSRAIRSLVSLKVCGWTRDALESGFWVVGKARAWDPVSNGAWKALESSLRLICVESAWQSTFLSWQSWEGGVGKQLTQSGSRDFGCDAIAEQFYKFHDQCFTCKSRQ